MKHHIRNAIIILAGCLPLAVVICTTHHALAAADREAQQRRLADEKRVVSAIRAYETAAKTGTLDERAVALGLLTRALWQAEGR